MPIPPDLEDAMIEPEVAQAGAALIGHFLEFMRVHTPGMPRVSVLTINFTLDMV